MPNHVTQIVQASPDVLRSMIRTLTPEAQLEAHEEERKDWPGMKEKTLADFEPRDIVDFELVVPSPPNKEKGGCGMGAVGGIHPDTGEVCWYEWNTQNWGTKWGAYSAELEGLEEGSIQFETAWSHAAPVLEALSRKFPEETIEVRFADEDTGSNCGQYTLLAGDITVETVFNSQDEAFDFAARMNYGMSGADLRKQWADEEAEYEAEEPKALEAGTAAQ